MNKAQRGISKADAGSKHNFSGYYAPSTKREDGRSAPVLGTPIRYEGAPDVTSGSRRGAWQPYGVQARTWNQQETTNGQGNNAVQQEMLVGSQQHKTVIGRSNNAYVNSTRATNAWSSKPSAVGAKQIGTAAAVASGHQSAKLDARALSRMKDDGRDYKDAPSLGDDHARRDGKRESLLNANAASWVSSSKKEASSKGKGPKRTGTAPSSPSVELGGEERDKGVNGWGGKKEEVESGVTGEMTNGNEYYTSAPMRYDITSSVDKKVENMINNNSSAMIRKADVDETKSKFSSPLEWLNSG